MPVKKGKMKMFDDRPISESEKESRRKKGLENMARFQKEMAEKYPGSDTRIEDLDMSIRTYRVLKLAGVNKVSDICTADFSDAADLLSIRVIDEIKDGVFSDFLKTIGNKPKDDPVTKA